MLQKLFSKLKRSGTAPSNLLASKVGMRGAGYELQADPDDPLADVPRYPPFDTGIPLKTPDQVVASQSALVARIFRTAGVSQADFARFYEPIIHALARHHHLLPATATSHHRGAGGLFRMALELGLHALQGANGSVFPNGAGIDQRFYLLPKWNLATFIAGISSQSYRTVVNMIVLDRKNTQWAPLLMPLYDWARSVDADVFFIRWTEDRNKGTAQATSAYLVNQLVSPDALQYLSSDNNQIVPMMSGAITGNPMGVGENPIAKIIAPATTRIIEDDLKRSSMNYGHLSIGMHLEPHLIDAMRRLIRTGVWAINYRGMRLWIGTDGTFIEWDVGAQDVVNLLTRDAFAGVPRDPDTLADMLCNAGVFEKNKENEKYWTIVLPGSGELIRTAVKVKHHDLILPSGFNLASIAKIDLTMGATAVPGTPPPAAPVQSPVSNGKKADVASKPIKQNTTDTFEIDQEIGEIFLAREEIPAEPSPATKRQKEGQGSVRTQKDDDPPARQDKVSSKEAGKGIEEKKNDRGSEQAERLLGSLKKENAWLMREILKAWVDQKLTGQIVSVQQGVGISHEELSAHGQPAMDLVEEMQSKSWLWVDKTKPTRKLHMIQVNGKSLRMIVLRPDIASGLGFS